MKILQVITSLHTGGAEKIVVELTERLLKRGHQVDVALFQGADTQFKKRLEQADCKIISFSENGNVYNPSNIFRLRKIIGDYDIIHTHNTAPQLFAAIADLGKNIPKVTTEHSTTNRRRNMSYAKIVDRWMYNRYNTLVCISDKAKENVSTYLGNIHTPIITIYNGVDVKSFHNAEPDMTLRNQDGEFVVAMVARFNYPKNQDILVKAIKLLPDNFVLWLVGGGERKSEVENLVKELDLESRVKFLGVRSDVPNILKAADVVVMATHYEGMSLSNIEGMSVQKPFIATDVDGIHETTIGAGILVPDNDEKSLAEAIKGLYDDPDSYNTVAEKCYERSKQYDIDIMVDKYEALYQSLISK